MNKKFLFNYINDYISNCFYKTVKKKPKVMSSDDTVDYILKNSCSIARFGDGELRLMRGVDLEFQQFDKQLAKKLKDIKTNSKCLCCIPSVFNKENFNNKLLTDKEYYYWKNFIKNRGGLWNKYFNKNNICGDAFISRFYIRSRDKSKVGEYVKKLKRLWQDRDIVFVEGEKSRLGVGNDLFDNARSVKRILGPATDAFSKYEQLKNAMIKHGKVDTLFILALGPTATVLAYEMSDKFQCLDLGHIDIEYEWFKMGVQEKVVIKSKYVNEVSEGRNPENIDNKKYINEIIENIT